MSDAMRQSVIGHNDAVKALSTIRDSKTGEIVGMTEGSAFFVSTTVGSGPTKPMAVGSVIRTTKLVC